MDGAIRRAIFLSAVAWIPLATTAIVEAFVRGGVEPVLRDLSVHVRLLVAIPLFCFSELLLIKRSGEVLDRLADERIIDNPLVVTELRRWVERLGHSPLVQATLFATALLVGQLMFWGILSPAGPWSGSARTALEAHGPASLWYAGVAFPLFFYVGLRILFHWLVIWSRVLISVARLPLHTSPAHPDRAAGIGFLVRSTDGMVLFVLACSAVLAGDWGTSILYGGARVTAFIPTFLVWLVAAVLLTFGPLCAFAGRLMRMRRAGEREYGRLGLIYGRRFDARWTTEEPGPELLGSPDIQSLSDLGQCFDRTRRMRPIPFRLREVLVVVVAALLPMIPLLLSEVRLALLAGSALRSLVGHNL